MGKHTHSKAYRHLYATKAWQRLRLQRFKLDNYTCRMCGLLCTGTHKDNPLSPVCDHIQDHKGDENLFFDLDNTQTLCKSDHDKLKRQQDSRGYHSAVGVDGWPIDERHPANR